MSYKSLFEEVFRGDFKERIQVLQRFLDLTVDLPVEIRLVLMLVDSALRYHQEHSRE